MMKYSLQLWGFLHHGLGFQSIGSFAEVCLLYSKKLLVEGAEDKNELLRVHFNELQVLLAHSM